MTALHFSFFKMMSLFSAGLSFREAPAGDGFGEVGGVLVLAEGGLRLDAIDVATGGEQERLDVAAVFLVVDGGQALPNGAVSDFLRDAFEDDRFVGMFGANCTMAVRGDVFCLSSIRAGAEPEGVLPPDTPNQHEMRTSTGAWGGDPVVVGFFETFERPGPVFQSFGGILGHGREVWPVRAAWLGFPHDCLRSGLRQRAATHPWNRARATALQDFWLLPRGALTGPSEPASFFRTFAEPASRVNSLASR